jgi:hypothetical protein
MAGTGMRRLRSIADAFLVSAPTGVSVRDRLKGLTPRDEAVLRAVGAHLGSLASTDLAARCADGTGHDKESWAARKRQLTPPSSSRWAGALTRASNEQWALARRSQAAHLHRLQAGIDTLRHRLSQPLGANGSQGAPGGYASRQEWHAKSRRLAALEHRHAAAVADWEAGRVRVVRGKRLLNTRHHLDQAGLTQAQWRSRWEAARFFLSAAGESGKRHGNETIRITPEGQVSIRLPAPLAHLANAPRGRYVLSGRVVFAHRGAEWADRVEADGAVAYRIHLDTERDPGQGRWYVSASWTPQAVPALPMQAALARGVVGVDANNHRKDSRHDAASIAVGRRAQGHPVRRRTAPPPHHQGDGAGHRTARAAPGSSGREGNRPPVTERAHDARGRTRQERGDPAHPAPFGMGAVPA